MKAKIRQFSDLEWSVLAVSTDPLTFFVEKQPVRGESRDALEWAKSLPTTLVNGVPISIWQDPQAWLAKMARIGYTRLTVEITEFDEDEQSK